MGSKYLIINADDFGICNSVNSAIFKLLKEKKISSATLMPNVNYYEEAVEWTVKNSDNIGLHLTFLNDDSKFKYRSLSRSESIENKYGYLFGDRIEFSKKLRYKDIKKEIDMQFNKLKNDGIKISHVDLHRYAIYPTYNPCVYMYLCKKCREEGKLPMRWARNGNVDVESGIASLCDTDNIAKFFAAISDLYGIPIPDYVFKFPYRNTFKTYSEKKMAFINMLRKLPDGINEVHIHPSVLSEEIKEINPTWQERVLEYEMMFDDEIKNEIEKLNIKLITYKDINRINKNISKVKAILDIIFIGSEYSFKFLKSKILRGRDKVCQN
ncbi:MAG: carbohydrate deacetylase [Thomasclavelia spiroformis]